MTRRQVLGGALVLGCGSAWAAEADPWTAEQVIEPATLAQDLKGSPEKRPTVLYVGFPVLYRSKHIVGAQLAGPASKAAGLEGLRKVAGTLPKDRDVVIYCGCCPWDKCPNVRPAFQALREMGFTQLAVVRIPTNLSKDWVERGFPVEGATA